MKRMVFRFIILMICLTGCGNDRPGWRCRIVRPGLCRAAAWWKRPRPAYPTPRSRPCQPRLLLPQRPLWPRPAARRVRADRIYPGAQFHDPGVRGVGSGAVRATRTWAIPWTSGRRVSHGSTPRLSSLDLATNRTDQQRLKSDLDYNRKEMERYQALVTEPRPRPSPPWIPISAPTSPPCSNFKAKQVEERVFMERLKRFTLTGPSGWKVVTRYIEPGEWITTGEKVAELGRFDVLHGAVCPVQSGIPRAQGNGRGPFPCALRIWTRPFRPRLARVSPGFDEETRKINVDLEITQGDFQFRGGPAH